MLLAGEEGGSLGLEPVKDHTLPLAEGSLLYPWGSYHRHGGPCHHDEQGNVYHSDN